MKYSTKHRYIVLLALIVNIAFGVAAEASFNLIPPQNTIEGRNFSLTFRLTDADAAEPAAPELSGCDLLFGPAVSTMQSTQIVNGQFSSQRTIDYTFTYRAVQAGTVQVPTVSVRTENGTLTSRPATFTILPPEQNSSSGADASANEKLRADRQSSGRNDYRPNPSEQSSGRVSADDLIVRVFFSKNSIYEQEPVIATIKVYTKYDINSFLPVVQPAFEGFLTEELNVQPEVTLEQYNGRNYHTVVLKQLLLYPQRSGRLSVNSGKYDVTIVQYETVNMGFFRTSRPIERQVTTTSNAAAIEVKPLPSPAPEGFHGAVGQFTVSTKIDPEVLRSNESSTYSYIVSGTGNIKYLSPANIEFPSIIESYTPRTNADTRLIGGGSNMRGTYTTDITIVPTEVGEFTIEGTPLVYFDPSAGEYKTAEVEDMPIRVLRGTASPDTPTPEAINREIEDILHIHPNSQTDQRKEITYTFDSSLYWLAYLLLTLALVGTVWLYRRQIRLNADVSGRRLAKAGRVAAKRLKAARVAMEAHKSDEFHAALSSAVWGYLSDKLSIPASQLTRDNIADKLADYGLDEDKSHNIIDVLDQCEMARFTPSGSDQHMAELYQKASESVNALESVKKK